MRREKSRIFQKTSPRGMPWSPKRFPGGVEKLGWQGGAGLPVKKPGRDGPQERLTFVDLRRKETLKKKQCTTS